MSGRIRQVALITSIVVLLMAPTFFTEIPEPYELDNGLTVILRPVPAANQVAVVVLFDLGGDHDPVGRSGRAHILEHLYCTAATDDMPARDFMQIQKRYVAGYNQQTGFDYTVFAGVVKADHLVEELKDAAARMSALRITEADLKREVPRVLLELRNMYGGIPTLAGINHIRLRLHPIPQGGRHGGNAKHIKKICLGELQQLWQDYYKPNNAILVLAGRFDVAEARKLIQQCFGPIPSGKAPPTKPLKTEAKTGATGRINVKPIMQKATGVASVGYVAPLPENKDYAPFLLIVARLRALGQGSVQPGQVQPLYYPPLDDPATIVLQTALMAGKDAKLLLEQLDQRLQTALTPKLKPQDKLQAINSMAILGTVAVPDAMWVQNLYGLAFSVGRRYQLKIDGNELRAAIQRVSEADLQRLATSVFAPEKRNTAIVELEK